MKKIRITRSGHSAYTNNRLKLCLPVSYVLETGETLRRGCGRCGLQETDVGWHCFYCGNYLYRSEPSLKALWFHFRVGREYWRTMFSRDKIFINGVPVTGSPDSLPRSLSSDLLEPNPPVLVFFFYFL